MDGYLFDCRHERNTFLSSVQRRLSGGSVRSSRLTRRPRDKGAELVPLGREIDDCQVEAGLRAANEIGDRMSCGLSEALRAKRTQLFHPRRDKLFFFLNFRRTKKTLRAAATIRHNFQ